MYIRLRTQNTDLLCDLGCTYRKYYVVFLQRRLPYVVASITSCSCRNDFHMWFELQPTLAKKTEHVTPSPTLWLCDYSTVSTETTATKDCLGRCDVVSQQDIVECCWTNWTQPCSLLDLATESP